MVTLKLLIKNIFYITKTIKRKMNKEKPLVESRKQKQLKPQRCACFSLQLLGQNAAGHKAVVSLKAVTTPAF